MGMGIDQPWDENGIGMGIKCTGMGIKTWEWENIASTSNSVFVSVVAQA